MIILFTSCCSSSSSSSSNIAAYQVSKFVSTTLKDKPFCVIRGCITKLVDNIDIEFVKGYTDKKGKKMFNMSKKDTNYDESRKMVVGEKKFLKKNDMNILSDVIGCIAGDRRSVSEEALILSLPDGEEQALHQDFPAGDKNAKNHWSIFVGIMNGSKLNVVHEDFKFTITYNKGDIVVMRGDVIHCGARYTEWNLRLHYYCDCKDHRKTKDKSKDKSKDEYRVNNRIYLVETNHVFKDIDDYKSVVSGNEFEISVIL